MIMKVISVHNKVFKNIKMFKTLDQIRSQFTVKQHYVIHSTKVTMKRFQRQIQKVI